MNSLTSIPSTTYVHQWIATGRWFSPDTPVSTTNKTDHQDTTEILLKVALNTIMLSLSLSLNYLRQSNNNKYSQRMFF